MKTATKRWIVFLGALVMAGGLAWLSGYDFDKRGVGVALCAFYAIAAAAFAAACPLLDSDR